MKKDNWAAVEVGIVRKMIPGPTPMHLVNAPVQSSGKSYFVDTCLSIFGPAMATNDKSDNPEEWAKSIFD